MKNQTLEGTIELLSSYQSNWDSDREKKETNCIKAMEKNNNAESSQDRVSIHPIDPVTYQFHIRWLCIRARHIFHNISRTIAHIPYPNTKLIRNCICGRLRSSETYTDCTGKLVSKLEHFTGFRTEVWEHLNWFINQVSKFEMQVTILIWERWSRTTTGVLVSTVFFERFKW